MTFDSFELDPALLAGVRDLGFSEPTDIQRDAIPWALEGRDVLACAMTGSGKTAAFALSILQKLLGRDHDANRALVLSPTRELALQTERHFRDLGKHTDVEVASIFGGVGYEPQERAFREGTGVLVATPGRLLDHLRRPYARLDRLEFLVLDEADRMLDMGFIPDVRRILSHLPTDRQTMLFSATMDKAILRLAGDMLRDPVTINLESRAAPAIGVRQVAYPVRHELKPALLAHLLERHDVDSALVFTRTKERADLVGGYLKRAGVKVAVIHGDRTQQHRTRAMDEFKAGRYKVLVATDVAARGIDVEDLSHVINLDVPNMPDDYIHRVGRTARAGATGDALTFVAARELAELHLIEKTIGRKLERIRLDDFDYSPSAAAQAAAQTARLAAAAPVLDAEDEEPGDEVEQPEVTTVEAAAQQSAETAVAAEAAAAEPVNKPRRGRRGKQAAEETAPVVAAAEAADGADEAEPRAERDDAQEGVAAGAGPAPDDEEESEDVGDEDDEEQADGADDGDDGDDEDDEDDDGEGDLDEEVEEPPRREPPRREPPRREPAGGRRDPALVERFAELRSRRGGRKPPLAGATEDVGRAAGGRTAEARPASKPPRREQGPRRERDRQRRGPERREGDDRGDDRRRDERPSDRRGEAPAAKQPPAQQEGGRRASVVERFAKLRHRRKD